MKDNKEIRQRITTALDEVYVLLNNSVDLYIAGGSALAMQVNSFRATPDIDLIRSVRPEVKDIFKKYIINDDMATSTDPNISEDFRNIENICDLAFEHNGSKVFIVWKEVIAIVKAFHRQREKDIEDVEFLKGKLDTERLDVARDAIIKSRNSRGKDPYETEIREIVESLKEK